MPPQTQQPSPEPKQPELESHTVWFMIAVALFYDVLSILIPSLVAPVAGLHFWLWFKLHGIPFAKPKRLLAGSLGFLVEIIPLTSWVTAWTPTIAYLAWSAKKKA